MVAAVDKYFTRDAFIWHPLLNLPASADARENLKGIYTMLCVAPPFAPPSPASLTLEHP